MKKLLCLFLSLLLCGCAARTPPPATTAPEATPPAITTPVESITPETTVPETAIPETTEAETQPLHSALYIPGVTVEDIILYFNEVVLDAEYVTGDGNPSVVQKWTNPILYHISGTPTLEDLATLEDFNDCLNSIDGFPGIREADAEEAPSLRIHFCDYDTLVATLGQDYAGSDGGVTFWYIDNEIYDATICIRTDLDQHLRNSVILEELYNGLGPVQDTLLRPDSIIASEYSEPQALTEIDEVILKLLYHPDIRCGMDAAQCEEVIRQLYY